MLAIIESYGSGIYLQLPGEQGKILTSFQVIHN
jgi:hypothetical protein